MAEGKKVQSRSITPKINCPPTTLIRTERHISFRLVARIYSVMSLSVSRTVLRQSTKLPCRSARRFESTTSKATEAARDTASKASKTAKDTAANIQSKASEGLSRVSSAAGPAISGAAKGLGNALGKIGGRTGKLIAFIERMYKSWASELR